MVKRMIVTLVAMAVFIGAIGLVKFRQIQAEIAQAASFQPPPEAVTTIVAQEEEWRDDLRSIGSVAAVQGVVVSADLPGIVERIAFESGRTVRAGDVLVELDTKQEEAQLAAAEAQRDLAALNLARVEELLAKGVVSQAEHDRVAAEWKQSIARVNEIRATIERKTVRAPFSGLLGIRQANLGQYLTSGDPVVPLQSPDPIYVNFAVPQQEVGRLRAGAEVRAAADQLESEEAAGRVAAVNSVVDEATRNVLVQAAFENPGGRLRPGMFVEVRVLVGEASRVVSLPASSISYAPYGDAVFIVEDVQGPGGQTYRGVRQQFVRLGGARGDQVAVLAGVSPGEEVVTSGAFKLRNGAAVVVNNEIQPANDPTPQPEDS